MSLIPTNAFLQKIMQNENLHDEDAFNGATDLLSLGLFTNEPSITRNSVYADFTKPTYTGYADITGVVWGSLYQRSDGGFARQTPLQTFQMGDADEPTTLFGYFVWLPSGTVLYMAEMFPTPVQLVSVLDALVFASQFVLGGSDWGTALIEE